MYWGPPHAGPAAVCLRRRRLADVPPRLGAVSYMALPLEVFEERYLIMMANLLKTVQARFGVVLIEHQLGAARRCPENDPLPSGIAGRRTSSSLFSSGRRTNQAAYTGGLPWPLRDGRHWPDQSRSMLDVVDQGIPPAFRVGATQMRCVVRSSTASSSGRGCSIFSGSSCSATCHARRGVAPGNGPSARPLLSTGEADNGSIERQFVLMRPSRGVGLEGQLAGRLEP